MRWMKFACDVVIAWIVILLFLFFVVSGSGFSLLLGGERFWWLGLECVERHLLSWFFTKFFTKFPQTSLLRVYRWIRIKSGDFESLKLSEQNWNPAFVNRQIELKFDIWFIIHGNLI